VYTGASVITMPPAGILCQRPLSGS
jgi:hypothetical protein